MGGTQKIKCETDLEKDPRKYSRAGGGNGVEYSEVERQLSANDYDYFLIMSLLIALWTWQNFSENVASSISIVLSYIP